MLLYLFYNADLLDITGGMGEMGLGYVDDVALMVVANDFMQAHRMLKNIMLQPRGSFQWSKSHNSKFKTPKSVLMDFSHSKTIACPPLTLHGTTILPADVHKFIGVM